MFTRASADKGRPLRDQAAALLDVRMWGMGEKTPNRDLLAPGDDVVAYVGVPERAFIGHALLGSPWQHLPQLLAEADVALPNQAEVRRWARALGGDAFDAGWIAARLRGGAAAQPDEAELQHALAALA